MLPRVNLGSYIERHSKMCTRFIADVQVMKDFDGYERETAERYNTLDIEEKRLESSMVGLYEVV
jgi:hypothetical protein